MTPISETTFTPEQLKPIKVRAVRTGVYNHERKRGQEFGGEGDVFMLEPYEITQVELRTQKRIGMRMLLPEEQFSDNWMERVDEATPEHTTGAPSALKQVSADIKASRRPGK